MWPHFLMASTDLRPNLCDCTDRHIARFISEKWLRATSCDFMATEPCPNRRLCGRVRSGAVGWDGRTPSAKMSESGADRNTVGHPCRRLRRCSGDGVGDGQWQIFTAGVRAGTWKPENLGNWHLVRWPCQPEFQDFRISVFHSTPDARSQGPGRGGFWTSAFGQSWRSLDGHHYFGDDYCTSWFGQLLPFPNDQRTATMPQKGTFPSDNLHYREQLKLDL